MKPFVLGLTGGTGCGKSMAADYLKGLGAHIVDADAISRYIMEPGMPALQKVADKFGNVLLPDGTLNRKKLASIVFCDDAALRSLNEITHTYIIQEIERKLAQSTAKFTIIDAPLLFEAGLDRLCDACLCMLADDELRKARIMARDGLTEGEAKARIAAQKEPKFYKTRCRFMIENNNGQKAVFDALDAILKEIKE